MHRKRKLRCRSTNSGAFTMRALWLFLEKVLNDSFLLLQLELLLFLFNSSKQTSVSSLPQLLEDKTWCETGRTVQLPGAPHGAVLGTSPVLAALATAGGGWTHPSPRQVRSWRHPPAWPPWPSGEVPPEPGWSWSLNLITLPFLSATCIAGYESLVVLFLPFSANNSND